MSLEQAFARALADQPESHLARRVKKSMRHFRGRTEDSVGAPESKELRDLGYRFEQLGRRWSSFRLGGCAWVGPIERLRSDWQALRREAEDAGLGQRERVLLLGRVAQGLELRGDAVDCRGRSYLLGVVESLPSDRTELCQLEGVRLFSPLTLFAEVIHDLGDHSLAAREAIRDGVASLCAPDPNNGEAPAMDTLIMTLAQYLEDTSLAVPPAVH